MRTPMPVNAPKGQSRDQTEHGEVVEVLKDNIVRVKMDGHGLKVVWVSDTLEAE